ncbi:MAG: bifunctional folylpolyglutamate synthase/dihydrofolate synthase [Alistipes sp.]|nr:bifunctional folylpolyglutamate synthase/dihydrofolate synthase [Alistipes sp.]
MDYSQTLDFLYHSLPVFQHIGGSAYKAGLERIEALEEALGNPHRRFRSIHIAGTNGKGSVSHMIASVLQHAGYRTGLFTSPHLKDFRERIRINGKTISEQEVVEFVEHHREAIERVQPSFFEITTAIAFDAFARHEVDIAVVEVGMGGRLDSTNLIRPLVSVITNISLDHTQFLGDTLPQIAGEKAGIIKPETPVVIGESQPETQVVFIERAKALQSPILFADQLYRIVRQTALPTTQQLEVESRMDGTRIDFVCDLQGVYQRKNLLTALAALDQLNGADGLQITPEAVHQGIASAAHTTGLLGRWQTLGSRPTILCDTGHNVGGLTEVTAQLARQTYQKLYIVLGFVADKDIDHVLPLFPREAYYLFTRAAIPRALDEKELAQRAARFGLHGECQPSVAQAVERAKALATPEDCIFIGGSTFVVAEVIA